MSLIASIFCIVSQYIPEKVKDAVLTFQRDTCVLFANFTFIERMENKIKFIISFNLLACLFTLSQYALLLLQQH